MDIVLVSESCFVCLCLSVFLGADDGFSIPSSVPFMLSPINYSAQQYSDSVTHLCEH